MQLVSEGKEKRDLGRGEGVGILIVSSFTISVEQNTLTLQSTPEKISLEVILGGPEHVHIC